MDLPFEVLMIVFLSLHPNGIIEISPTCKLFNPLSRKNKLFVKTFNDFKKLIKEPKWLHQYYYYKLLSFLFVFLKDININKNKLNFAKDVLYLIRCIFQFFLFVC